MASMSKGYSAKIGLDISDVDKKVNSLSRELKTIDNSLKTNGDSAALLSQRYTVMGEKAQALSEKLKLLEGARSDVMNAFNNGIFGEYTIYILHKNPICFLAYNVVSTENHFPFLTNQTR